MNSYIKQQSFFFRFFLELMIKSMVEHLATTQSLDAPRKMRFSEQFTDDVVTLVTTITSDIISRYNKDTKVTGDTLLLM